MLSMAFNTTRSIMIERGAAARLATQVLNLGASSVLLVTDAGVMAAGLLDPVLGKSVV